MFAVEENVYLRRIQLFMERLHKMRFIESIKFEATYSPSGQEHIAFADRLKAEFRPIKEGDVWGQAWDSAWFHLKASIPPHWAGGSVVANLNINGEGLITDSEGKCLQGISNQSVFVVNGEREIYRITPSALGGEPVEYWLEGAANALCGVNVDHERNENMPMRYGYYEGKVNKLELALFDEECWQLHLDMQIAWGQIKALGEKSVRRARLIRLMSKTVDVFMEDRINATKARAVLAPELAKEASSSELTVFGIGHAHLDTAWLWSVKESVRKLARTFATQLELLDRYPDYIFGASQVQHFVFIKEHYPELYARIKEKVKEGRWECQGGMWVEADCNLIGGESMVRQFLHGKNFFKDEFDKDINHLWLPDVFGYAAAMPQILQKSGCPYFVTQKISWNQFNEFPHNTFKWQGIDGSEVLSHFPPENDYNCAVTPESLVAGQERFKEKDLVTEYISLFGIGDGGGGPTEGHIERGLRQQNLEGSPKFKFAPATDFLATIDQYDDDLPRWEGELYLELHRGTYTTHALVKKRNRKLEFSLRALEMLNASGELTDYQTEELDWVWKKVLLNQFHDIIPGSSINSVYKVTHKEYDECEARLEGIKQATAAVLFDKADNSAVLFNPLNSDFTGLIELPAELKGKSLTADSGDVYPSLEIDGQIFVNLTTKALSYETFLVADATDTTATKGNDLVLENELIRYEFNAAGQLISAFDKEVEREVIPAGKPANLFSLYIDRPNFWDAWDVDKFYMEQKVADATASSSESITVAATTFIKFNYAIGNSTIAQRINLKKGSKRLDFDNKVHWQEEHKMLRVAFPAAFGPSKASFDIQFGFAERSTNSNTSYDMAQFEVCAHRYADISESNYGMALLNDCKYGYKVRENIIDLNLLRAPTYPDADADMGDHQFSYSLLPHSGDLVRSNVQIEAEQVNEKPLFFNAYSSGSAALPILVQGEGVRLETIKKAEKEDCWILRLVETKGDTSTVSLEVNGKARLAETNLIEWEEGEQISVNGSHKITLTPFEIRSYKLFF